MNSQQQVIKYCDKIVELGVYGIAFLIPHYFDIHLYSTFDLSKVGLMYLMTLIMLAAWLVKMTLTGNFRSVITPITIPVLAFWLSYIISTVCSINPMMSLIGTYKRYEGLCAITSYILQFFFVINFIDSREKLYHLLRAFLYAGFVGGVYGAIQHFGKDPLSWESYNPYRLISTFGNPVFFGGYVLMVFMIGLGMYLRVEGTPKLSLSKTKKKKQIEAKPVASSLLDIKDRQVIISSVLMGLLLIIILLADERLVSEGGSKMIQGIILAGIFGLTIFWLTRVKEILWVILYTACVGTTWFSFLAFRLSYAYWTTFLVYAMLIAASILFFRIPKNFFGGVLVYGASVGLMYYGFSFTTTRGAYIGMFGGIIFFLIVLGYKGILENKRRLILLGAVILAIFINFNLINQKTSVIKRFTSELFSLTKQENSITKESPLPVEETMEGESLFPTEQVRPVNIPIPGIKARFLTYNRLEISVSGHSFTVSLPWRVQIWGSAIQAILDKQRYFWLGIGPDTMGFVFPRYVYQVLPREVKGPIEFEDRVHNDILDTALARGVIGLGIYWWLLLAFFISGIKCLKKIEPRERVLMIGIMAAVVGFLGQNLVSFGVTPLSSGFWLLLGAGMVAGRQLIPNPVPPVTPSVAPLKLMNKQITLPFYLLIIIMLVFISYLTIRAYLADNLYKDGTVYLARGDLDTAIAKYEQAVKLHPYEVRYQDERNRLYVEKARKTSDPQFINRALQSAEALLEIAPEHSNAFFTLAIAYYLKGDTEKAIAYYKKTAEINPFSADAYNNMGVIFTQQKRLDEAIESFKEAYRLNTGNLASLDNLARIYLNKNMLKEASLAFEEILRANPTNHTSEILNILGMIYFKQNRFDKVIKVCQQIISQDPKNIPAHENLGSMYYKQGRLFEAKAEFETILQIQPDNLKARQMLSTILLQTQRAPR